MNAARTYKSQTWKSIVIIFRRHFFHYYDQIKLFRIQNVCYGCECVCLSMFQFGAPDNQLTNHKLINMISSELE